MTIRSTAARIARGHHVRLGSHIVALKRAGARLSGLPVLEGIEAALQLDDRSEEFAPNGGPEPVGLDLVQDCLRKRKVRRHDGTDRVENRVRHCVLLVRDHPRRGSEEGASRPRCAECSDDSTQNGLSRDGLR